MSCASMINIAAILAGLILGFGLAVTNWTSKFAIGSVITTLISFVASMTKDKITIFKEVLSNNAIIRPVLLGLNVAFVTFILTLGGAALFIFSFEYLKAKRAADPEALTKAWKRGFTLIGTGIHYYVTSNPDVVAEALNKRLKINNDIIEMLFKAVVKEVAQDIHGVQHFHDVIEATGRSILQLLFNDGPDLQQYRMALFLLNRDRSRLEYKVAINNGDWTAHSMKGFNVNSSFMGEAFRRDEPVVYPKQKKGKIPFEKRSDMPYKSFIVLPVPCGQGGDKHIGAITVDCVGKDEVFTQERKEVLFAFGQMVYAFHQINLKEPSSGG